MTELKVGVSVADKNTGVELGVVTRLLKKEAIVKHDKNGTEKYPTSEIVVVQKLRPAKASAPSENSKDVVAVLLTDQIQVKLTDTKRSPPTVTFREFGKVADAHSYLKQFELIEVDGRHAKFGTDPLVLVTTNYAIERILAGKKPGEELPSIGQPSSKTGRPVNIGPAVGTKNGHVGPVLNGLSLVEQQKPAKKARASSPSAKPKKASGLIPLKNICADLGMEPRDARIRLRKAKDGDLPVAHEAQGRWEWLPDQVAAVSAFLKGENKPAEKKKPKAASVQEETPQAEKPKADKKAVKKDPPKKPAKKIAKAKAAVRNDKAPSKKKASKKKV